MAEYSERDLERLFALDAGPGPARAIDDARSAALIAGALGGAGFPPPMPGGGGSSGAGGAHGGHGAKAQGAKAAAHGAKAAASASAKALTAGKLTVLAGGAITATLATVAWIALRAPAPAADPRASTPTATTAAVVGSSTDHPAPALEPPSPTTAAASPATDRGSPMTDRGSSTTGGGAAASLRSDGRDRASAGTERPPARHSTRRHSAAASPTGASGVAAPSSTREPGAGPRPVARVASALPKEADDGTAATTPDDLLAEANAARAAHRWREADALYARVARGERGRLAVQTALVASGSIHLEHLSDPAGAAQRFRAALAGGPRAALAEDARWGLAEAARITGDPAGERLALDEFLVHHAGSPRAPRARARRTELGAAP